MRARAMSRRFGPVPFSLTGERTGPVCAAKALEDLRRLAKADGFDLPENCLRHSFTSYRLPVVSNNKPQVASEAGNSVGQIDARYRVPLTEADGKAWFAQGIVSG